MARLKKSYFIESIVVILLLIFLAGCNQKGASANVNEKLELAVKYLTQNKFEEAVLAYQEIIKIDPKNITAYKGLSVAFSLQGKAEQAEQALHEGLKKVSDSKPLKLSLAGLMASLGEQEQAAKLYQELIAKDTAYIPAYQGYTKLLVSQGKKTEAISLLEKALTTKADQYQLQSLLAETYLSTGDREKALAAINKSLSLELDQASSYKLLEQLYLDKWQDLTALGDQYIEQKQETLGQLVKLLALSKMGQFDELIKQYELLPAEAKENTKIKMLLAEAYLNLDQKEKAKEILNQIKQEQLKDAQLVAEIADFYLAAGDKEQARKLAKQGLKIDETAAENYVILYKSYLNENKEQANIWLARHLLNSTLGVKEARAVQQERLKPIETRKQPRKEQTKEEKQQEPTKEQAANSKQQNQGGITPERAIEIPSSAEKQEPLETKINNENSREDYIVEIIEYPNKPPIQIACGEIPYSELWIKYSNGNKELLVACNDSKDSEYIGGIFNPQISIDGSNVYFESSIAVTSNRILAVNIQTKKVKEICAGNNLKVIRKGDYKGKIIVSRHEYLEGGGSINPYYIVDDNGNKIKALSDEEYKYYYDN